MRICFATNNQHKLKEVSEILGDRFELISLREAGFEGEIPETHETLEENSLEKAQFVYNRLTMPVFSDDSGLEVDALGGKPSVHSADYAGSRDAKQNMGKVLAELGEEVNRKAQFRTVITFMNGAAPKQFEGIVEGHLTNKIQGEEGFGYDPIFIPKGYDKTFAELSADIKNSISHRKKSIEKLAKSLNNMRETI